MIRQFVSLLLLLLTPAVVTLRAQEKKELPREWIDPETGHRVIRLSDEPGSQSLYFHQNPYTPDGEKLLITTPTGLSAIHLKTRTIEKIVDGRVNVLIVGKKSGQIYYVKDRTTVYATDLNTRATREIVKLPPRTSVTTVNADETLLAGIIDESPAPAAGAQNPAPPAAAAPPATPGAARDSYPGKEEMMERRLAERRPLRLITVNTKTGEIRT